jgi:hypothetical protein
VRGWGRRRGNTSVLSLTQDCCFALRRELGFTVFAVD